MQFEAKNALRRLNDRTPQYFLSEIFAHGDLKVRVEAAGVLKDLDPDKKSNQILREMLKLI